LNYGNKLKGWTPSLLQTAV